MRRGTVRRHPGAVVSRIRRVIAFTLSLSIPMGAASCAHEPEDCGAVVEPGPRVECRLSELSPLVTDPGQLELALTELEDPTEHDLVALRLMVQSPSLFPLLCPRMKTPPARDRCQRLEERPHLSERARRPDGAPAP